MQKGQALLCVLSERRKKRRKKEKREKWEKKTTSRYDVTSAIILFLGLLIFYIKADSLEYFIFLMKREVKFHNFL